jgi:hypothetical protein
MMQTADPTGDEYTRLINTVDDPSPSPRSPQSSRRIMFTREFFASRVIIEAFVRGLGL